jgi:hypothetical protein
VVRRRGSARALPVPMAVSTRTRRWRWVVVLVVSWSLVLLGPTGFPRAVDVHCPEPSFVRDDGGSCFARGELLVMTSLEPGGLTRTDLEVAIAPLGGRIETAIDSAGLFAVRFAHAETVADLDELEAVLEGLGFQVMRNLRMELFGVL